MSSAPAGGRVLLLIHKPYHVIALLKPPVASYYGIKSKVLSVASELAHDPAGCLSTAPQSVLAALAF